MEKIIQFELNGNQVQMPLREDQSLLWALRTHFNLTGTKYGCGLGFCGACTVLMDNEPVRSCIIYMADVEGKKITTIEGLAPADQLHPIQQAFVDHDAMQCGYCTPGMIMNAYGLLLKNPSPSRKLIIEGMNNNYCRCGAHSQIVDAVESVSNEAKLNQIK